MTDGCVDLQHNNSWKCHQLAAGQLLSGQPRYGMDKAHCNDAMPKIWIFPGKELRGYSTNSYIHVSVVIDIFPWSVCLFYCRKIDGPNIEIAHRHINVEIETEAAQFHFLDYINTNFFAVKAVRPVHHIQKHTCRVTPLQPARRAAVLGQPSCLQPHWFIHNSRATAYNGIRSTHS